MCPQTHLSQCWLWGRKWPETDELGVYFCIGGTLRAGRVVGIQKGKSQTTGSVCLSVSLPVAQGMELGFLKKKKKFLFSISFSSMPIIMKDANE